MDGSSHGRKEIDLERKVLKLEKTSEEEMEKKPFFVLYKTNRTFLFMVLQ